jgi:hypothetical protein
MPSLLRVIFCAIKQECVPEEKKFKLLTVLLDNIMLTPQSIVFLEKLIVIEFVAKSPSYC